MIAGATYTLPLDIGYPVQNTDKIIITLKNESTGIKRTKRYPNDEETRLLADGRIGARLTQQDTVDLVGYVKVEAQINLKSGSVAKTTTERTFISPTLNTEMVVGAADNGENLLDGVTLELGAPITVVEGSEGTSFQPGNALELKDGILNVLTTDDAEQGNNLPITSKGARKLADNISYNDLKDKPFDELTNDIHVGSFELELSATNTDNPYKFYYDLTKIPFGANGINSVVNSGNVGKTVCVDYDNVRYVCEVKYFNQNWWIGNTGLIENFDKVRGDSDSLCAELQRNGKVIDTGEPFLFVFHSYYSVYGLIVTADINKHSVELYRRETQIEKIDPKFIPFTGIIFLVLSNDNGGYNYECNKSNSELRALLTEGQTAIMMFNNGDKFSYRCLREVSIDYDNRIVLDFREDAEEWAYIWYSASGDIGKISNQ